MINKYITGPWLRLMRQPYFVICIVILVLCAAGLHAGAKWLQWNFRKEAVALSKSFSELDRAALGSYQVIIEQPRLPAEIESELGTTEYINWTIEDTSVSADDPARNLRLFVAYYTGDPGKVPHVPEICGDASGGQIFNDDNTEITVPGCGLEDAGNQLPIRIVDVEFPQMNQPSQQQTVAYFFAVNGDYRCTRNGVRLRSNYWRDRYAYYSKVEITLAGPDKLTRNEALAAVEKLCRVLVPLLWSEHWPDWESVNSVKESHDPGDSIDFP